MFFGRFRTKQIRFLLKSDVHNPIRGRSGGAYTVMRMNGYRHNNRTGYCAGTGTPPGADLVTTTTTTTATVTAAA